MFDVEQKHAARPKRLGDSTVNALEVGDIMQHQIADDQIPAAFGIFIVIQRADAVGNPRPAVAAPRLSNHFFTAVNAQDFDRAVLSGISAVPSVAAARIEHAAAVQRGKQRLKLMPFSRAFEALPAAVHLSVLSEKCVVIIRIFIRNMLLPDSGVVTPRDAVIAACLIIPCSRQAVKTVPRVEAPENRMICEQK